MGETGDPSSFDVPSAIKLIVSDPRDGWWFAGVFEAFAYLESEFGFRLDQVHQHFRGNFVRYEGPTFDLIVEHDPDDTGHVRADLWVRGDLPPTVEHPQPGVEHPRAIAVNDLLRARDPKRTLPDLRRGGYSPDAALDALATWADGLRTLAPDVLFGAWPADVPWRNMW
jgi:hypothetical protein